MAKLALAFDILAKDRASKEFGKVGDSAEKAGKRVHGAFSGLGKGLIASVAGLASIQVFKGFVEDAEESRKVGRLTAQVIKSTGKAAHISADQVGELATAISTKTGVDDEAIQSGANLLLTFTNVRNEVGKGNDIFNQATQLVTDMSVALGQDAKAGAIQLGKALNDPIKGVTALSKVGVSFTQQQKDQIKTLVASGRTLDAQKVILAELSKEFGGAAEAAATPSQKLNVAVGNLKETIGTALLPVVDKAATFLTTTAVPAIQGFVQGFQDGVGPGGELRDVVTEIGDAAKSGYQAAKPFLGFIADHPKLFTEVAKDAVIFAGALKAMGAVKGLAGTLGGFGAAKGGLGAVASLAKPLPVVVTNLPPGGVPVGGVPVPGVPGTVAEGRFGKIMASSLVAQAVTMADVVLGEKAFRGLKDTVFPLRFKLSVNDAANQFLKQLQDPATDAATRAVLQRHFAAVGAGVAEAAKSGDTRLLEQALTATYADVRRTTDAATTAAVKHVVQQYTKGGKDAGAGFSNNLETLIGGGLTRLDHRTARPHVVLQASAAQAAADRLGRKLEALDHTRISPHVDVLIRAILPGGGLAGVHRDSDFAPKPRALGGPVLGGQPYVVGEREPELFVPRTSGRILNGRQMAAAGIGGATYNITVNNPIPEPSSSSLPRVMSSITYLYGNG